jgi:hypothetical protein
VVRITEERVRAAYEALGFEPEEFDYTTQIVIVPDRVTIERVIHDEEGNVGWKGGLPTIERITIEIDRPRG